MLRALSIALIFASAVAFAEPARIAVQPFKGAKAAAVRSQLTKKLCKSFTCVTPGKGEDVSVDAVVVGKVAGNKLSISVYFDEDENPVTTKLALKKGKLAAGAVDDASSAIRQAVDSRVGAIAHAD